MVKYSSGRVSLSQGAPPRDPDADRARLRRIHETARAGDLAAAAALAEAALADGLTHPMLFNLAATRLEHEGRFEDALALLERGQSLAPGDVGLNQALGLVLYRLERYAAALRHFDAVIAAQPDFAPAHATRGGTLEALGDIQGAQDAYRRADTLQPGNLAALSGLASLASRRGQTAQARELAERVVQAQPNYPDAVMVLAAADQADGLPAQGESRLLALLADDRPTPQQKALAQGLLGDLLDTQDRTAEAFAAYRACNESLLATYAPRLGSGPSALDYARETLAVLDEAPPGAWGARPVPPGLEASGHVFLMGFPRSGTTLLEQVLASHPDVEALEERDTLYDATQAYGRRPRDLEGLAAATPQRLADLREAYWRRVAQEGARPQGKLFVDKHPLNTFRLPVIARLFPDARVLFARRDPRDVVLSCFRRRFGMSGPMYQLLTLPGAADFYDAAMRMGERLGAGLPLRHMVVRHESLIEDFDGVAREVCGFLDLPWTPALRGFADRTRDRGIATPSGAQLARGLSAEGIGQWRRYAAQMAAVLPTLRPWVDRFGYPAE